MEAIPGLRSAKRRIEIDGASFYNDFSNVLHSSINDEDIPLAINTGTSDWTVSTSKEVALMIPGEEKKSLIIIDPVKKTRIFQTFSRVEPTDLVFTKERFALAGSGLLISGVRADDGSILIKGAKGVDRGINFRLRLEDEHTVSYSKRGTCYRTFYDLETRKRRSEFEPRLLWNILFNDIFEQGYIPTMPDEDWLSFKGILTIIRKEADNHKLNSYGVRLYALVSALERNTENPLEELEQMVAIDSAIQCKSMINEPFPCHEMLQTVLGNPSIISMHSTSISQVHIMRSVRMFEDMSAQLKNTKLLSSNKFTDTKVCV